MISKPMTKNERMLVQSDSFCSAIYSSAFLSNISEIRIDNRK